MKELSQIGRARTFKDAYLNQELDRLWRFISSLRVYPKWRLYTADDDALYLQVYNSTTKQYNSRLKLDTDGNMTLEGTSTPSTDIADKGRV